MGQQAVAAVAAAVAAAAAADAGVAGTNGSPAAVAAAPEEPQAAAGAGTEAQPQDVSEEQAKLSPPLEAEAQALAPGAEAEAEPVAVRPLSSQPATSPGQSHLPRCPGCNSAVLPNPRVCIKVCGCVAR